MKKIIFGIFIFVFAALISMPEADALTINYKELNPGDLITVHVAKNKTEQFYFVKECEDDDRFAYAILKDVIDLEKRTYTEAETYLDN